jgi:hypothetical protein
MRPYPVAAVRIRFTDFVGPVKAGVFRSGSTGSGLVSPASPLPSEATAEDVIRLAYS